MNNTYDGHTGEEMLSLISTNMDIPNIKYMAYVVDKLNQYAKFTTPATRNSYGSGGLLPPPPPLSSTEDKPAFFASDGKWYTSMSGASINRGELTRTSGSTINFWPLFAESSYASGSAELSKVIDDSNVYLANRTDMYDSVAKRFQLYSYSNNTWSKLNFFGKNINSEISIGDGINLNAAEFVASAPRASILIGNVATTNTATYKPFALKAEGNNFSIYHVGETNEHSISSIWDSSLGDSNALSTWEFKSPNLFKYHNGLEFMHKPLSYIVSSGTTIDTSYVSKYFPTTVGQSKMLVGSNAIKIMSKYIESNIIYNREMMVGVHSDSAGSFKLSSSNLNDISFGLFSGNSSLSLKNLFRLSQSIASIHSPFSVYGNEINVSPVDTNDTYSYGDYGTKSNKPMNFSANAITRGTFGRVVFKGPFSSSFSDASALISNGVGVASNSGDSPTSCIDIAVHNAQVYNTSNLDEKFTINGTSYQYLQRLIARSTLGTTATQNIIELNNYYNSPTDRYGIIKLNWNTDLNNKNLSGVNALSMVGERLISNVAKLSFTNGVIQNVFNLALTSNGSVTIGNSNKIIDASTINYEYYANNYTTSIPGTKAKKSIGLFPQIAASHLSSNVLIGQNTISATSPISGISDPWNGDKCLRVATHMQFDNGSLRTTGVGMKLPVEPQVFTSSSATSAQLSEDECLTKYYYRPIIVTPASKSPSASGGSTNLYYNLAPEGTILMLY